MSHVRPGSAPGAAFRFHPGGPSWDVAFLRRLAESLSARPPGRAVLVEVAEGSEPLVVPGTSDLEIAVVRAAEGLPGRLERRSPVPHSFPLPAGTVNLAVLHGLEDSARPTGAEPSLAPWEAYTTPFSSIGHPEEPVARGEALLGRSAVQWHWFSTGGPRIAVRARLAAAGEGGDAPSPIEEEGARLLARLPRG